MRRNKRNLIAALFGLLVSTLCTWIFCSCIPPFIDGAVEPQDYFENEVECVMFRLDPDADGGYVTSVGDSLSLTDLTDGDETNVEMHRYCSFKFTAKKDVTLKSVAFFVEVEENATLDFTLDNFFDAASFKQSIDLNTDRKGIVSFDGLGTELHEGTGLKLSVDPLTSNVRYRIDTVIFVV